VVAVVDLLIYDKHARYLGWRYGGLHPMMDKDDVYQAAMIAAWTAKEWLNERQRKAHMRYRVLNELHKYITKKEYPLEWAEQVGANDRIPTLEADAVDDLGRIMAKLPDAEYQAVCLRLMGVQPVRAVFGGKNDGWMGPTEMSQVLRLARKRLRRYIKEVC
jgi:DNA-directed RNA polymerase specialized sigma24 family protein